ncbi:tRNA 2-selenouridine(34) synthase MnmH [Mangrovicoccus sp. HB161399]|uniref:tRNA 2-selenouridine(34) synthase MnmH n=1 Tax=Mangrovicoccus sp. HB161399 TaxID=2720392 RepID=UPI00155372E5|nr:tRNA 2-selenouridine(34) synthase MnmH [Mangrovicoccus sp. HB161399]
MLLQIDTLSGFFDHGHDDVIDVRSPAEFAEDHVPGAINLPVLDNEERAKVGTIYKQESRFGARKIGAALVIRNIARHLETELADRPAPWRPMVYCWRGGQRSGTFTWLLREVGWRAGQVDGGYRTYRRLVAAMLHDTPLPHRFVVLSGMTCTAKTALLEELARDGMQVLDLEGLARHRGSVFGGHAADPQPAQKMFESRIAQVLTGFDPSRPVVVEAESSKIGDCLVPPRLWERMCGAPRVEISAPLEQRSEFFLTAYADLVADPDGFCATLDKLVRLQGHERVSAWQGLVRQGAFRQVAAELMELHYDPRYARSEARHGNVAAAEMHLASLAPAGLRSASADLAAAILHADAARTQPRETVAG